LTGLLCRVYFDTLDGLRADSGPQKRKKTWQAIAAAEASQHGSLLVVGTLVAYTKDFMVPRLEEICREVLKFTTHQKALMRLEVARLIPRLAVCLPLVFGRRFLDQSLMFLIESASAPTPPKVSIDIRPSSFTSIGLLVTALTVEKGEVIGASNLPTIKISDDPENPGLAHIVDLCSSGIIYEKLDVIFALVRRGLAQPVASGGSAGASTVSEALHCASQLVEGLGELAHPYIRDLIDEMFSAGLSGDLIRCLHSIAQCVPDMQSDIEERILQEVSYCLAGMRDAYDPLAPFQASALEARARQNVRKRRHVVRITEPPTAPDEGTEVHDKIRINSSDDPETVKALVLSLQTLAFFGGMKGGVTTSGAVIPLLPFVQDVAAQYLHHPSSEVRRAAALSCCVLLVVPGTELRLMGRYTGGIVEDMLRRLLRVAISDPSPVVRLCVVRALDSRYDAYLCQNHHLQELFVLMQDEAVVTRAAGLRLLGRLAQLNPAPILPVLRRFLDDLIVELQCGVDSGRGREDATRLLVVFLRAKPLQRLIPPVLASLIASLPLDGTGPPRLASASLEALGVLAEATGQAFQPWLKDVVPHVLEIMQDQSSASKQRTSLRTLGQIAGSTGYVVRPYLDYPDLLTQATGILPATKRAPWSLRREVIRTLGILGALDPDRVLSVSRKSGAVGGAYFEELDVYVAESTSMTSDNQSRLGIASIDGATQHRKAAQSSLAQSSAETDEDLPACLFMYEQYTMAAQPLSTLQPARRLTPLDDDFYPTVAIQALMRIFRDQALVAHHGMVIQAIMFIFKSLGVGCVPYLRRVVPSLLLTVRTCSSSTLREALLKQLVLLSPIAREHLRPYIADVFDLVEQFWSSRHLATILSLISKVAVGVPDEFRRFVPRLIKRLLTSLDEVQVADWASDSLAQVSNRARAESEKLSLIVRSVSNLRCVLGDYLHVLVPAFIKLADALASLSMAGCPGLTGVLLDLSTLLYRTISVLLESQSSAASVLSPQSVFWDVSSMSVAFQSSENGLPSRVVQPLVRLLRDKPPRSPTIGLALIETICVCARLIGAASWMKLYDTTVRQAIRTWQRSFSALTPGSRSTAAAHDIAGVDERLKTCMRLYDDAINDMFRPPPQPQPRSPVNRSNSLVVESSLFWVEAPGTGISSFELSETFDLSSSSPFHFGSFQPVNSHKVNQSNLQRAWDVSQSTSREDWDEWIRRLAIQLLREAPSPALRATASLAHAYQPLARELFSAAFACCWKELTAPYRMNLVHALETAFVADVSPEILQALLNLAEFMEYDPDGLPIDIPILADLALKCRAYAKAINYREREYSLGRSNSCVESLMSINQKLDLPGKEANLTALCLEPMETCSYPACKLRCCPWNPENCEPRKRGFLKRGDASSGFGLLRQAQSLRHVLQRSLGYRSESTDKQRPRRPHR
jgi:FKBP12-rapamycin complex-associated protein